MANLYDGKHKNLIEAPSVIMRGFSNLLSPLSEQKKLLHEYNERFWGNEIPKDEIDEIETTSDHAQIVNDLEFYHVEFKSVKRTMEAWSKVIMAQTNSNRRGIFITDEKHLRLLWKDIRLYEPGIHRIRINLVAYWNPERNRIVVEVREKAHDEGRLLAHAEVLSAYGLNFKLLKVMDGKKLPFANLAGYEATVDNHPIWTSIPCLYRLDRSLAPEILSRFIDRRTNSCATPEIIREEFIAT